MAVSYTYSISVDFIVNNTVNSNRLVLEIDGTSLSSLFEGRVDTEDDDCLIWFASALSGPQELILDALVAVHTGLPLPETGGINNCIFTVDGGYVYTGDMVPVNLR